MMQVKRRLSRDSDDSLEDHSARHLELHGDRRRYSRHKRIRLCPEASITSRPPNRDIISSLPAELLVRILSYLSESTLLEITPVSRLFHRVTSDGQLWRLHYYRRFILPRAHLIPGFRKTGKVANAAELSSSRPSVYGSRLGTEPTSRSGEYVDWKQSYKLLHNWARGRCDVEELQIHPRERMSPGKTLVKVVERLAITADSTSGLLIWDLPTRSPVAQTPLGYSSHGGDARPTCLAVDDEQLLSRGQLGIAAGFEDGSFGVWHMDLVKRQLVRLSRPNRGGIHGGLEAIAYCQPYVLGASSSGHITLWTLEHQRPSSERPGVPSGARESDKGESFAEPYMLHSLRSHSTRAPLTLSMRRVSGAVIASIAYTLDTVSGWCIGIQDLDIRPSPNNGLPEITDSRVAHTVPVPAFGSPSPPLPPLSDHGRVISPYIESEDSEDSDDPTPTRSQSAGPIRLCYSHPYLLATLPDNTLMLHLCTTTSTTLKISSGIRLWGHTSGISDAEITTRGKAVSVSARGDEIRVWELEGRVGGCSVEVRPRQQESDIKDAWTGADDSRGVLDIGGSRKNKVGFDEEMVIVLKEALDGRESLMVYDFT